MATRAATCSLPTAADSPHRRQTSTTTVSATCGCLPHWHKWRPRSLSWLQGSPPKTAYAWMWGGGRLYATHLVQLLEAFHVESMCLCLGLCHSGGFIDELRRENRVIATSCAESEESWACTDRPYDEFVYHWTCAVAGHDPEDNAVCADTDGDGYVSMAEAFDYASQHDRRQETPQYCSTPLTLGGQWFLSSKQGSGIKERQMANGISSSLKCYDLQGRVVPVQKERGRNPKRPDIRRHPPRHLQSRPDSRCPCPVHGRAA